MIQNYGTAKFWAPLGESTLDSFARKEEINFIIYNISWILLLISEIRKNEKKTWHLIVPLVTGQNFNISTEKKIKRKNSERVKLVGRRNLMMFYILT